MPSFPRTKLAIAISQNQSIMSRSLKMAIGTVASVGSAQALAADVHNIDAVAGFTSVSSNNNVHEVTNNFQTSGTAVNVFNHFVVGSTHTVNLQVPSSADKLLNVVRSSRPEVHGILNSYKDGTLGGNVVFASSQGFLIGASGVVNVGGLSIKTPTASELNGWIDDSTPGFSSDGLDALDADTYAVSTTGVVTINGKVTASTGINIVADQLVVGSDGKVIVGNSATANYVDLSAVNVGDLSAPTALISDNGSFEIIAEGQSGDGVDIAGEIHADGGIVISAAEVTIQDGAVLDTRDKDGNLSGSINIANTDSINLGGDLYANAVILSASNAVNLSANVHTESLNVVTDDDDNILSSTPEAGTIEISAAQLTINNSGNAVILADTQDDALVVAASGNDQVIVGNITLKGDADITADTISISAGNKVAVHDIEMHADDININGELIAAVTAFGDLESSDEEVVSLGSVHLDGDANYDDMANITAATVKVTTLNDIIFTDDITKDAAANAAASDLVWVDAEKFVFNFGLDLNANNITNTSGAQIEAQNVAFTAANHIELNAQVTATDTLLLDAATLDIQFDKLIAAALGITTSNYMVFSDDDSEQEYIDALADGNGFTLLGALNYSGDLTLSAASITITQSSTVTADNITLESSDTNIDGLVVSDGGDSDDATFGTVTLIKDADYADISNLSFSTLSIQTDKDIILSADKDATTTAGNILWIDESGFTIAGDLSLLSDTLTVDAATDLAAHNLNLTANTYDIQGTLTAQQNSTAGSITLGGGIDSSLDLSQVSASDVSYTGTSMVWDSVVDFAGDLYFDFTTFELTNSGSLTAHNVDINASDSVTVSGDIIAQGNGATGGNIDIAAPDITLNSSSLLDARLKGEASLVNAGDITLTASTTTEVGFALADSNTSIDISGVIKAGNLDVSATSLATASYYSDIGATITLKAVAQYLGADFAYMEANADADINVHSGADIQTAGYVNINAESHAMTDAMAVAALGGVTTISLAGMYGVSDASSTSKVHSGASIVAGGDIAVTAHNEAYLSAAAYVLNAEKANNAVLAAAYGEATVDATAIIESGATIIADDITVAAENLNRFYVSASTYGLKDTRYGLAVAIADIDTSATAQFGASAGTDANKVGNVTVLAHDRTVEQRVHSGVTVGSSLLLRTIGSQAVNALTKVQNGTSSALRKNNSSGESPAEVKFKGGLSFSLNLSDHEAHAYVGTNTDDASDEQIIVSDGDVVVAAITALGTDNDALGGTERGAVGGDQGGYRTSAETAIASPSKNTTGGNQTPRAETSLAIAFNLAINDSDAVAQIGEDVNIKAVNVGVLAEQTMPIVSTYDKWDTFSDIVSKFNGVGGLQNNLLTSFANAGATADKNAYGGSLNVAVNDMDTKAWIADGAYIETTGTGSWNKQHDISANSSTPGILSDFEAFKDITLNLDFDGSIGVHAYNQIESIHIAGNMGTALILPNGNGTNESGTSIGAAISFVQQTGSVVAGVGEASLISAGDVSISAETDERHFVITPTSGMGSGFGFNGAAGILNSETLTHASLSNKAYVFADDVVVVADHQVGNWAASGAVNWSDAESVGISIAVNLTQGDTKAYIGDNSDEYDKVNFKTSQPTPSSPSTPDPSEAAITARNVTVRAKTSGTNGALAVAGALTTEPSNEPGFGDKFENSFNGSSSKLAANYSSASSGSGDSSASSASSSGSNDSGASGDSVAEVNTTDWSAAGSFNVAFNNLDAKAMIDGATIQAHDSEDVNVTVQALQKIISASASGSAAVTLSGMQSAPQSNTVAGAIAYQISFNDSLAWLQNSSIDDAGEVKVQAVHAGELTSVALALAATKQDGTTLNSNTAVISVSGATVRDGTSARIDDTDITGADGNSDSIDVSAYNSTDIGVGGGSLFAGGKQGYGLAITFADIGDPEDMAGYLNPDDNNSLSTGYEEDVYNGKAIEAVITGSDGDLAAITNIEDINVSATSFSRIGIGAAGIGVTDANGSVDSSISFMGSFAIGVISSETHALVQYADISNVNTLTVDATGDQNSDWDSELSELSSSSVNDDFDFSGGSAIDNTNVHTSDDGSESTYDYSQSGERIIAVAGVVQAGKKNLGISYAHADVKTEKIAQILNSEIDATGGSVDVSARDEALLYTVSIGLGVSTGSLSGVGSVAVNRLNNQVHAQIGDWDNSTDSGFVYADSVSVTAQNDMDMINVAGAIAIATGGSEGSANAGGLAVALNLVGTDDHSTKAYISNIDLQVADELTVKAASGSSNNENLLVGNAIAAGISTGSSGGLAFAGAIAVNNVDQTVHAGIKDVGDSSANEMTGDVIVQSYDYTDSASTAWMLAASTNGVSGGVAVATNRVDSDVTAEIKGNNVSRGSTFLKAQNVEVDAARNNWLLTISAGVAASKQGSLAGSVGTGVVDGNVIARITDDAKIEAYNNVLVNSDAKTVNMVGSGALGIGMDTGAGAVAISTALEYGETSAYIEDANVKAYGKGSNMTVDSGDLASAGSLPDLSTSGQGEDDGDDSNADAVDMDDLTTGFDLLSLAKGTESASGLVVNATSRTKQQAIVVGGAGGKSVAINANVATNVTFNDTKAYIENATINENVTGENGADVLVRSGAHEAGLAVSAGIAISGGGEGAAAGVAGFATNSQKRSSTATIDNSDVNANELTIDANTTKVAQAVSAGVAAGVGSTAGLGGAGSVVITEQFGNTKAWLRGGTITTDSVDVISDRRQETNVAAGAVGIGTSVGVGIGLAVNIIGGDSIALIGNDLDDSGDTATTTINSDDVNVDADRVENVNSYAFGAGISASVGVAAMVNTTEFRGETRAAIHGYLDGSNLTTDIRDSDGNGTGNVTVNAQEIQNADQWALGIGVGNSVGVGAVANVVLGRSQVFSEVVGSDISASLLDIDATAQRQSELISIAGAASTSAAAALSIGVALYGQGDATADDGTSADAEYDASREASNSIMAEDTASYNTHLSAEDIAAIEADSGTSIARNSGIPATTTTTESGNSLSIDGESVTAARISGGTIDVDTLNVDAKTLQHSYQGLGAAQISSYGIAGVIGITRSYEMAIATVDSEVDANEVSINASIENVSDDDGALEMKSAVIGLGGTSVVVNYTDARSENRVLAGINSAQGDDSGNLTVTATDSTEVRLGDTDSGIPSSVTDGALNVNLGAAAIGVSVGYASKDSDIDAWIGEAGKLVDGYQNITLSALNEGLVKSTAFALSGGLLAGVQGVITMAYDDSDANATLSGTIGTGAGIVNIDAQSAPELYASSYGVTLAGGAAMGASFAYAITDTKAQAEISDGTIFTGSGDVVVRSETGKGEDGYETAHAAAFAASGGLLAGLAGTEARATNNAQSIAKVGDGVYIPDANFEVYARNTGAQVADADGYFVGFVAGGYQTGLAKSFTTTRVEIGNDPIATLERSGEIIFDASSVNNNQSFTTAGGGGYYSGSAAESIVEAGDHGDDEYSAAVIIDDWYTGYTAVPVDASSVTISASNQVDFFAGTDATTVSVVGGSGATSYADIDTNAKVILGDNVSFAALNIEIDAKNVADQIQTSDRVDTDFSTTIFAGGGGGANGTAGLSNQNIKNLLAEVNIGENSVLKISDLAWLDSSYDHGIFINASTDFYIWDESKLEVGGALQGAGAESDIDVDATNKVSLGDGVKLYNPVGEIAIGTYGRGEAVGQSNVSVWAAAGVAGGVTDVNLDVLNQVHIGDDVDINAYGEVGIYAGRGSDGFYENQLRATAYTNVYNWTAIPIPANMEAKSDIDLDNQLFFGDGFSIASDSHVNIEANEGLISASHSGVEKNPYLELFGSETNFGSSDVHVDSTMSFLGNGSVVAGQYAYQWVSVAENGAITKQLYRYGSAENQSDTYSSAAELEDYIVSLEDIVDLLEAWDGTEIVIDGITLSDGDGEDTGSSSGSESSSTTVTGVNPYLDEIDQLKAEIVALNVIVGDLSTQANNVIKVADIKATAGNVNLLADTISFSGVNKPTFTAKGEAYISVDNDTDKHLMLDNLEITNQTGGNVFVTGGAAVSSNYIDEQSSGQSGIHIDHGPEGANKLSSDVIITGGITNLLSSVNINVAEGDLIQQASVRANAINISVPRGSLFLSAADSDPVPYGRAPEALVNFTDQWKPSSSNADDFVQYYINAKYENAIDSTSITDFNNWFTGRAIRHTGDQISYYQNSSTCKSCDYGYDEMNIYFNWGFANDEGTVRFDMKTNSSSRGGSDWYFIAVEDKTSSLTQTATYTQVKNVLGEPGALIVGEKVVITADRVDINGLIEVGTDNSWSVDVGSGFDSAIANYIDDAGLSSGDQLTLVPGQQLSLQVENPDYNTDPFNGDLDYRRTITKYYDFDISQVANSEAIGLTYDVGTDQLLADDIPVSGGGYVSIVAKISSTGEDGNIVVKDGLGQIDINNDSSSQLVLGTLSAGDDATGVIRITDNNYSSSESQWYVHTPGEAVKQYETSSYAVSYSDDDLVAVHGSVADASLDYNPQAGQLFYIREGATVQRTFDSPDDGYFAKYGNTVGNWYYKTDWHTETSYYTTCASKAVACTNGVASNYLLHTYEDLNSSTWNTNWILSYDKYYGQNFVDVDPLVSVAYELDMDTHTYIKADNAIKLEFSGLADGNIDISSNGNIEFTGNVYNPSGSTSINTSNQLILANGTAITSDVLDISAKWDIGSSANPLAIFTDELGLSSSNGSLYFDVTGTDGDVALSGLSAKYHIQGTVDQGIVAKNSSTLIQSDTLDLTSSTGGIGKVGSIANTASYEFINISTTGAVKLSAATDIAVNQDSGDLDLYTATASEEIVIKLGNGRLTNAIGMLEKTDEELAYEASVWDSLHLLDDDAGVITVTAYENNFSSNYHNFWMLKQRLVNDSDANFEIHADYVDALKLRYNVTTDAELLTKVKTEYQGYEQWFSDQIAAPDVYANEADAIGIEQKGSLQGFAYGDLLSGSYDDTYKLTIAEDSSWYSAMIDGAQWKQSQLDISISSTALNADASSQLSNREANIVAGDVHLMVNGGSVGEDLSDLVFTISRDGSATITDAQKSALLAAGAGDIETVITDSQITFNVKQVDPLKIDTSGELDVSASDEIYIEAASGLTLGQISSINSDIRLVVDGAISAKSGVTNISANDLFISNTQGDIGSSAVPVNINLSGALRQAGSASDMYLSHTGGDLFLGSISAGDTLSIFNDNDLFAYDGDSYISADEFILDVNSHDIGSSSNAIDINMSGNSGLNIDAGNAWLNVIDTSLFTLANIDVDNTFNLVSPAALDIQGDISANDLVVNAQGNIISGTGFNLNADNSLDIDASSIDLDGITVNAGTANLYATAGSLTLADMTIKSSDLTLLANGQMNLLGDIKVQSGNLLADASSIVMDAAASIYSSANMTLSATDTLTLYNLSASNGTIDINAVNASDVNKGDIRVNGLVAKNIDLDAQKNINLISVDVSNTATVDADSIDIDGTLTAATLNLTAANGIDQNAKLTATNATINSGNGNYNIDADISVSGILDITDSNGVVVVANREVKVGTLTANVDSWNIDSSSFLWVSDDAVITSAADISLGKTLADNLTLNAGGDISFSDQVVSNNNMILNAGQDVNINQAVIHTAFDNLKVTAANIYMVADSEWNVEGSASLEVSGDMELALITVRGDESISLGSGVNAYDYTGLMLDAENISLNQSVAMGQDERYLPNVYVSNLTVKVDNELSIESDVRLFGEFTADVHNLTMGESSIVAADGNLIVNASGTMSVDKLYSDDGAIELHGTGTISLKDSVYTENGAIDIDNLSTVSMTSNTRIDADGTLDIDAAHISMDSAALLDSQGDMSLTTSTGGMTLGHITGGGDVNISAINQDIQINNDLKSSSAELSINAANIQQAAATTVSGLSLTVDAESYWAGIGAYTESLVGLMSITTNGLQSFANVTSGRGAYFNSGESLEFKETVSVLDDVDIEAIGDVHFSDSLTVGANGGDDMPNWSSSVSISTDANLTFEGDVTVTRNLDVSKATNVAMNADVLVTTDTHIQASGLVSLLDGKTLESDNLIINSGSLEMGAGSQLSVAQDLTLNAQNDQTLATLNVGADFESTANGTSTFNEGVDVSGAITLNNGDVVIAENQTLKAGSTFTFDAVNLLMESGSTLDIEGAVSITTSVDTTVHHIDSESSITLDAKDNLTINGDVDALTTIQTDSINSTRINGTVNAIGNVDIDSFSEVSVSGDVHSDANLAISGASVLTNVGGTLNATGDVLVTSDFGAIELNDTVIAGGNLTIEAVDGLLAQSLMQSGLNLNITSSQSGVTTNGAATSAGLLAINSKGSVELNEDVNVALTSIISVNNDAEDTNSDITINDVFNSIGSTQLLADGGIKTTADLNIGDDQTASNLIINNGGYVVLESNLGVTGLLDIDALGAVKLSNNMLIQVGATADIDAASFVMASNSTLNVKGETVISTLGDTTLHNVNVESDIKIGADNLTVNGVVDASLGKLTSITSHSASSTVVNGSITASGNVDINSLANTKINGAVNSDANLTINANTGLVANAALSATDDLVITSANGSVELNDTVIAGGNLTLDAINGLLAEALLQSGLDLNITSTQGGVTTNGIINSSGLLAINAKGHVELNEDVMVALTSTISVNNSDADANSNITINDVFNSDGETQLLADGNITSNADLSTLDNLIIQSGDNVLLNGNVSVAGLLDLDAVNAVSLTQGKLVQIGTLDNKAGANIDSASFTMAEDATLDVEGMLQITTTGDTIVHHIDSESSIKVDADNITTNGVVNAVATIDLDSATSTVVNGTLNAIGNIDLDSLANTEINGTVNSDANLTINANTGLVANAALSAENDLVITSANGSIALNDTVIAGDNLTIDAINGLLAEALLQSGLDLNISSTQGGVTTNGAVTSNGLLAINAKGHVALNEDVMVALTSTISVNNNDDANANSNITINDVFNSDGETQLLADGSITTNADLITLDKLVIHSGNNVLLNGNVTVADALDINAAGALALTEDKQLKVASTSVINAASIDFASGTKAELVGQSVMVSDQDDIKLNDIDALSGLSLTSAGQVTFTGNVNVGQLQQGDVQPSSFTGDFTIDAAQAVSLNANQSLNVGGNVLVNAESFTMASQSKIEADGQVHVDVVNDIQIAQAISHADKVDAFNLNAQNGSINGNVDSLVHLTGTGTQSGAILNAATGIGSQTSEHNISSTTGLGNPFVVDIPWLSANTKTGDVNLVGNSDLHATLLKTGNGNIRVRGMEDLTIDELVGTPWLYVDGFFYASDMTMDRGEIAAKQGMEIENISLTASGPVSLEGPSIIANIDGNDLAEVNIALSGILDERADLIDTNIFNTKQLNISQLITHDGQLTTEDNFHIMFGDVTGEYAMTTPTITMNLDNLDPSAKNVDAQFVTLEGDDTYDFELIVEANVITTNAETTVDRYPVLLNYIPRSEDGLESDELLINDDDVSHLGNFDKKQFVVPYRKPPTWVEPALKFKLIGKGVDPKGQVPDVAEEDAAKDKDEYTIEVAMN